jgi:predicted DNA-binding transcriptional regulator AlpA
MDSLANIPTNLSRDRLLETKQTAAFLNVSIPHLRRLYRAKMIPTPIRVGARKYGWRLGALIDFVASKTAEAA